MPVPQPTRCCLRCWCYRPKDRVTGMPWAHGQDTRTCTYHPHCSKITKAAVSQSRRPSPLGGLVQVIAAMLESGKAGKWLWRRSDTRFCSRRAELHAPSIAVQCRLWWTGATGWWTWQDKCSDQLGGRFTCHTLSSLPCAGRSPIGRLRRPRHWTARWPMLVLRSSVLGEMLKQLLTDGLCSRTRSLIRGRKLLYRNACGHEAPAAGLGGSLCFRYSDLEGAASWGRRRGCSWWRRCSRPREWRMV